MAHQDRSLLDNPAWFSLTTRHAHLAQGAGLARRYDPAVAPFAGVESPVREAFQALGQLIGPNESVAVLALADIPSVEGIRAEQIFTLLQMVCPEPGGAIDDRDVVRLSSDNASEMLDLAQRAKPGPFSIRTVETGNYIGIRDGGSLIAMAGERMSLAGHVEISAVCVDDNYRGRGIAARLMNVLRKEIQSRGDMPILHVLGDNMPAIGLYRRLGFEDRQSFRLFRIMRDDADAQPESLHS
ncbi:GNAT family N-acetyltransferase [Trinickia dinghuensis]|uniref:GNAT family N-acetyltransferase n=1 Tax=Trinickia dinghuensis TaxID=2291023 RepID=A0A3D8JYG7_9BURK|nr:GNAT family N-acetyltransferase [Trinickia dinghuensis]RDU97696.1 GNAT family N-acetyltransferase [Trinickia dinghuensis]